MLRFALIGILTSLLSIPSICNSWEKALANKQAELTIYWNSSRPFIYPDADGKLIGIEFEIMESFRDFLLEKHRVNLVLNWEETETFIEVLDNVRIANDPNLFGIAAISITEERREQLLFTEPYLPDITVLVSSQGTPIMDKFEDISEMMKNMKAVTIKGTKYESLLFNMKEESDLDFEVTYIDSQQSILDIIEQNPNLFAFIDLPVYLILIQDGRGLTRQNLFTVRGTGYGMIMPLGSDWNQPFNEFLSDPKYGRACAQIISKYLGLELFEFIDNLYDEEQLGTSILTKEKEIQLELIKNANLRLEEERTIRTILIAGIVISTLFLFAIGTLFYHNRKTTKLLLRQKKQIEDQQEDIKFKNEQLVNRNAQLISLNEEKNNLVRILAHDLRSPLNQIIGLSKILPDRVDLQKDDKELVDKIGQGADRISQMITKILDVDGVEGNQILIFQERVSVETIMRDVASHYRETAAKKEIDIILGFCEQDQSVETDHLLLFLVLENLVSNAVKFSKRGTEVTLEAECSSEAVIFKIGDQGPGFTDKDKELLFNRFQKLSAKPTGDEPSTGLGLSIVRQYTQDLGGEVWLESTSGKGSTFFVKLPIS